jgi:hypothetical protein
MRIGPLADHHPPQSLQHGRPEKLWLRRDLVEQLVHPALIEFAKRPAVHAARAHSRATPDPISP